MIQGINNTSNDTFRRLFGNGLTYQIPKHQRDYSWENEQWSDLWYDIKQAREEGAAHYMGYLVIQTNDNKHFSVIDGQQRLTTICILILALIKVLRELPGSKAEKDANTKRAESIQISYIGNLDPLTLTMQNKLILNKNNDRFYKTFLAPLVDFPLRGLNVSEKLMRQCFDYFYTEVKNNLNKFEDIILYLDSLVDTLYFTVITVSDELNAFKVFETLNARGVQLSTSDLLKNYFFSLADVQNMHETRMREMEDSWADITGKLEGTQFSEYLRIYWNSVHTTVRKNELYRIIRDSIKNMEDVFSLLRNLSQQADVFIALQSPEDELWKQDKEIISNLQRLKLFNITQPLSLLLTAFRKLSLNDFKRLLGAIVNISFRYNIICGKNPNEQEHAYNALAVSLSNGSNLDLRLLKSITVDDSEFEQSFAVKEFKNSNRNNKLVRYILARIEKSESGASVDADELTLEHVLPESPSFETWPLNDATVNLCKYRLGNLTLLEKKLNKDIGNESFIEKKKQYAKSTVPMTKKIGDSGIEEWKLSEIEKRQIALAKLAKGVWRVNV